MAASQRRRSVDKRRKYLISGYCWATFGVFGLAQYAWWMVTTPGAWEKTISTPIAASIPILFVISVYANYSTDMDRASSEE